MNRIKRRHFLQLAGSTLATFGWSQNRLIGISNHYGKTLAQNTSRKLALLIGINQYDRNYSGWRPLQGCVTDIQLQKELLINCFGFQDGDILTLSDRQATRDNILTAFEEHLIKQAKPNDNVVFHYSGHGSRVRNFDGEAGINGTIVPVDSPYPRNGQDNVSDIMGHTLFLLTKALKTENVTLVLDCCYSGGATRGNLRVRSRSSNESLQVIQAEREYQEKWLSRLDLAPSEFIKLRQQGIAKGVAITSAKKNQLAADISFSGFAAGAFTYALTQYLWQQTKNTLLDSTINYTRNAIARFAPDSPQEPMLEVAPHSNQDSSLVYFSDKSIPPAEAVITNIDRNLIKLWLGGIDAQSINAFNRGSTFSAIDEQQNQIATIELESREGLIGYGKLTSNEQATLVNGNLLQEEIRSIAKNIKLKIGLDCSLKNSLEEVRQAFAPLQYIEVLPLQQGEVDYIFGKVTRKSNLSFVGTKLPLNSLGLFHSDLRGISNSFDTNDETIASAVRRLTSKLKSLLAIKLIRLTLNPQSSHLNITATLTHPTQAQKIVVKSARKRLNFFAESHLNPLKIEQIPLNTPLQFTITNQENRPLYINVLGIDAEGQITVIFPNHWKMLNRQTMIAPAQTLTIPEPLNSEFEIRSAEPLGSTEIIIVASTIPFERSLLTLEQIAISNNITRGAIPLSQPWDVIRDLIVDLDSGTRNRGNTSTKQSNYLINTTQMAVLSIPFQVV